MGGRLPKRQAPGCPGLQAKLSGLQEAKVSFGFLGAAFGSLTILAAILGPLRNFLAQNKPFLLLWISLKN